MNKTLLAIGLLAAFPVAADPVTLSVVGGLMMGGSFLASGTLATVLMVGGMIVSTAGSLFTSKPPTTQANNKQTTKSGRAPKHVTYGRTLKAGALVFAEEEEGEYKKDNGTSEEWLFMATAFTCHKINKVHNIWIRQGVNIEDFLNIKGEQFARYQICNDAKVSPTDFTEGFPRGHGGWWNARPQSWTEDMIGKGSFWIATSHMFRTWAYPNGIPTITCGYEGKCDIYDFRTGTRGYTNNAALVIADYFITYRGFTIDRFITSGFGSIIDAANLCDETVTAPNGRTLKRYTINGTFSLDEKPSQVIDDMLAACGGQLVRIGGKLGLLPAAYYGGATLTLTDDDVIGGDVNIQPEVSFKDGINTISGTYVEPDAEYTDTEYPPVVDKIALARDGIELKKDMNFRFVSDVNQARRLAQIELKRANTGGNISMTTNFRGLYARMGRVIRLDIKALGLTGEYRVTKQSITLTGGVELYLVRESASIYGDSIGGVYVPPPMTNLLNSVNNPTNVTFEAVSVGDITQGYLRWINNDPRIDRTNIQILSNSGEVILNSLSYGNSYKVSGLIAGTYTAQVQTLSNKGNTSDWVTCVFSIGKPKSITSVTVNRSNWAMELIPNVEGGVAVGTTFEFWHIADNNSYTTQQPSYQEEDRLLATKISTGASLSHTGLVPDRWNHYWIRSVNSYGESDYHYVKTGTTRDQSLVTTVIERLEAIEIQSANWEDGGKYGYKLFSNNSEPYEMPDGTVIENTDGLFVASNAVIRGRINAEQLHFSDSNKEITELGLAQMSGGGYKSDPLQGWAITSSGGAIFNDGLTCRGATIIGGTIVGAQVVTGSIVYNVDSDTDGIPDDLFYVRYPELPVTASPSYSTSVPVEPVYYDEQGEGRGYSQSCFGEFNVLSCTENKGEPNQARFRWGRIREGAMSLQILSGVTSKRNFYRVSVKLGLLGENGVTRLWSDNHIFYSGGSSVEFNFAGIDWIIEHDPSVPRSLLSGFSLKNKESDFYGSEAIQNGRIIFDWFGVSATHDSWGSTTNLNWWGEGQFLVNTNVDNDTIPI